MKRWLIVALCLVGVAAGWWIRETRRWRAASDRAEQLARSLAEEHNAERARLEAALAEAQARPLILVTSTVPTATVTTTNAADPETLIAQLTRLRIRSGPKRVGDLQEVVFRLRLLAHTGERAVPAIAAYLARFEDIEYPLAGEKLPEPDEADDASGNEPATEPDPGVAATTAAKPETKREEKDSPRRSRGSGPTASARSGRLQFEFLTPPTLRLGLVDVLVEIGGAAAESVLAEMLQRTGRGVEVAYVSRKLEGLAPARYRELAINSARELLATPPTLAGTSAFDRLQRPYLYSVFEFYDDSSFASLAPGLLVNPAGRLDRDAFKFLTKSTPTEASLPSLYEAFTKLSPTNHADRSRLLQTALPSAGRDPYANAMVREVLRDPSIPAELRGFVLQSLAHLPGRRNGEGRTEADPAATQLRLQFLDQLRSEIPDARLAKSFERAAKQLREQLNPPPTRANRDPRRPPR